MRSSLESDGTPCVSAQRKKRFPSRWSLRQLIYSSPILNRRRSQNSSGGSSKTHSKSHGKDSADGKMGNTSKDVDRAAPHNVEIIHQATSKSSVFTASTKSGEAAAISMECPLCYAELAPEEFWELAACCHRACVSCLQQYLRVEITESRVCISCPECSEPMHPNEIRSILDDQGLYEKYEDFMVRRVLAVDPDTRWCPAPDCGFAVIASECASCPKLKCERPGCDSYFCYHCKAEWHPNQTCDAARAQRSPNIRSSSIITYSQDSHNRDDIKPCPRCQVLIVKMDDGSCNHMMCAVCGAEFCWLCMKEINDLHYLSPSGCTFWGKKPWSRKKKILWQLGTLIGAPLGIALVAGITVPAMIIGIPVWVGRKLYIRYKRANKLKRNAAMVGGVMASVMISPILAGLAVGIGVPILLFYVYGVVPVSLCRSGGCGGSTTSDDSAIVTNRVSGGDTTSIDAASAKVANPSIGEASLSFVSASLRDADRESASTVALAGSVGTGAGHKLEVQADLASTQRFSISSSTELAISDDGAASTRALAGSVLNYKANGSDSCSCVTTEDCTSERVRFDDNVSFIASQNYAEKSSIGSGCSFRARCTTTKSLSNKSERGVYDTLSNDSICIDIDADERSIQPEIPPSNVGTTSATATTTTTTTTTKKYSSHAAMLRNQFFYSHLDNNSTAAATSTIASVTRSLDDKTIVEVSNETLDDKQSSEVIQSPITLSRPPLSLSSSSFVLESSQL